MTEAEFENLDEVQAELWIARRFSRFVDTGVPPDLALVFAVHPDVDSPSAASGTEANAAA
jgi:hypothetical protein